MKYVTKPPGSVMGLNPGIRNHLAQLYMRNIGVCVLGFAHEVQPKEQECYVLYEIEKFMHHEKEIRRNTGDGHFVQSPTRGIIVLVSHGKRAKEVYRLFKTSKELNVTLLGAESNSGRKQSTPRNIEAIFDYYDVLVAKADVIYKLLHYGAFWWSRVTALIIVDAQKAEKKSCTFSLIVRESYRSFSSSERPQILSIVTCDPVEICLGAVETNLLVAFPPRRNSAEWRSRPKDIVAHYDPSNVNVDAFEYRTDLRTKTNIGDPIDHVSDIELILRELGPYGVVLYERCFKLRKLGTKRHRQYPLLDMSSLFVNWSMRPTIENADNLVGVSHKALTLLEILHCASKAETRVDKLKVQIFAGTPVVAVALNQMIRSMSSLRDLQSRVVIGDKDAAKSIEKVGNDLGWQSTEADLLALDDYGVGDVNILVIASSNIFRINRTLRPLPPCGFIIRFDGSCANPKKDGGGGPCRVVVFQKKREDKRSGRGSSRKRGRNSSGAHAANLETEEAHEAQDTDATGKGKVDLEVSKQKSMEPPKKKKKLPKATLPAAIKDVLVDAESKTKYMRVAKGLQGPNCKASDICFLYAIRFPDEKEEKDPFCIGPKKFWHREDFGVVLTHCLTADDLSLNVLELGLQVWAPGDVGRVNLDFLGPLRLSTAEIDIAHEYMATMFSKLMVSSLNQVSKSEFVWGTESEESSNPSNNVSYRRNYLVLPLLTSIEYEMVENEEARSSAKRCINFGKMKYLLNMKPIDKDRYSPPQREELTSHVSNLEGNLYSFLGNQNAYLAGSERPDICPLRLTTRSKSFDVNPDGSIIFDKDLNNLINAVEVEDEEGIVKLSNYFSKNKDGQGDAPVGEVDMKKRAQSPADDFADGQKGDEVVNVDEPQAAFQKVRKHRSKITRGGMPQRFDPKRNRDKKRLSWTGDILTTHADKVHDISGFEVKSLAQSMLVMGRPPYFPIESFIEILRGEPMRKVTREAVDNIQKGCYEVPVVVPEMCRLHPITVSSLFLPACLFLLERHVLLCELREQITRNNPVSLRLGLLAMALSSTAVHEVNNYERLEFLGDSVLKLSTTNRIFTGYPHKKEGFMHEARKDIVSNDNLRRKATVGSLVNFLCFSKQFAFKWRPPGTDREGRTVVLNEKSLADVMEALCGAVYLSSAQRGFKNGSDSDDVSSDDGSPSRDSEWDHQHCPLIPQRMMQGYKAGTKFLQDFAVFSKPEPTREETLLSAIHSLNKKDSAPPKEIVPSSFPRDYRMPKWTKIGAPVEDIIKYKFKRRHLLMCALTHASYVTDEGLSAHIMPESGERLEFLGDAVIDFMVVVYLFEKNQKAGPGKLTELKGKVVSNETFARVTLKCGLEKYLFHSSDSLKSAIEQFSQVVDLDNPHIAEEEMTKHAAPKALGDLFEAILGAVFVDSGLQAAMAVCFRLLKDTIDFKTHPMNRKLHPQKLLLLYVERELGIDTGGPIKAPYTSVKKSSDGEFVCSTFFVGVLIGHGKSMNKKRAMLLAARSAYEHLKYAKPGSKEEKLRHTLQTRANELKLKSAHEFQIDARCA